MNRKPCTDACIYKESYGIPKTFGCSLKINYNFQLKFVVLSIF